MKDGFDGRKMATGKVQPGSLMWGGLMLLVVFLAVCTVFASVVTVAQAWQEHLQARWPEVTARVDKCGLSRSSTGRRKKFYIRCRLSYAVGTEQHAANLYSRNVPSPEIWQYPPNQIAPFEEWVDEHPQGTPIVVRYDPADHTKVVLITANAIGGPRTPSNVKLLEVCAASFLVLLTIARIIRPRSVSQNGYSSVPPNS